VYIAQGNIAVFHLAWSCGASKDCMQARRATVCSSANLYGAISANFYFTG